MVGTFDKFDKYEVTELPNAADITRIKIVLDGEEFRLDTGRLEAYSRELCLKNGELYRYVKWESPKGKHYELHFYRMVSLKRLHVIAQKVKILPQDAGTHVVITTGIDGKMTNSGTQHFSDREKRFYDQKYMQLLQETLESEIMFCHNTVVKLAEKYGRLPAITMESVEQFERLNEQLGLDAAYTKWHEQVDKIYLPKPRKSDQVIPQDKTYLRLADVDLTKYKKQAKAGEILQDYSIDQISKMQVSKQADILMMFFLLADMFEEKVKRANWQYYEKRTLHDSSLSLSTHCILACDMGEEDLAYELFLRSCGIDMGEDPHSSDEGIHAAAIGGIWQCVVYGFGGVRMVGNHLRIEPKLPKVWNRLTFELTVKGQKLVIQANHSLFAVRNETGKKQIEFWHHGRCYVAGGKQDCVVRII